MKGTDLLKRINEFMNALYTMNAEIQDLVIDKNYLHNTKIGIAILKLNMKINVDSIDSIMDELTLKYKNKYGVECKYNGDYIFTIDIMIKEIDKMIDKKINNKLNEIAAKKLLEEAFGKNE